MRRSRTVRTSVTAAAAAMFAAAIVGVAADPAAARVVDPAALVAHIHHAAATERLAGAQFCDNGPLGGEKQN